MIAMSFVCRPPRENLEPLAVFVCYLDRSRDVMRGFVGEPTN